MTLRPIGDAAMDAASAQARVHPRRRAIYRYHEHDEAIQRMLNAVEPDSYVRPHRHQDPDKVEVFLCLRGRGLLIAFDDQGEPTSWYELSAEGTVRGAETPPRTWHSLLSLEPGSVFYEVIEGPYAEESHKRFAPWAPEEPEAGLRWLEQALKKTGVSRQHV